MRTIDLADPILLGEWLADIIKGLNLSTRFKVEFVGFELAPELKHSPQPPSPKKEGVFLLPKIPTLNFRENQLPATIKHRDFPK